MKHKNLSWAQREHGGRARLARLELAILKSPKDMSLRKARRITMSEIRQRKASTAAKP